jgi:hypothetical protein
MDSWIGTDLSMDLKDWRVSLFSDIFSHTVKSVVVGGTYGDFGWALAVGLDLLDFLLLIKEIFCLFLPPTLVFWG